MAQRARRAHMLINSVRRCRQVAAISRAITETRNTADGEAAEPAALTGEGASPSETPQKRVGAAAAVIGVLQLLVLHT